jgi:hypothetical protein
MADTYDRNLSPSNAAYPPRRVSPFRSIPSKATGFHFYSKSAITTRVAQWLIVLHAFAKKTQKTLRTALNLALKRLKESGS